MTEFSEELEISRSALQEYLSGAGSPNLTTIEHIAQKLNVSPYFLLLGDFDEEQFGAFMKMIDILSLVSDLPSEKRKDLLNCYLKSSRFGTVTAKMAKRRRVIDPKEAISYRTPMRVVSIMRFGGVTEASFYPICPRCHITMEREYQSYCDRCGQALSWAKFSRAKVAN